MDTYSQSYGKIADEVWEEEFDNGKFFYNYAGKKIKLNEDDYYRRSFYPLKGGKTVKNETKV